MSQMWTIFRRELLSVFTTPVAYIFLVIFLISSGSFSFIVDVLYPPLIEGGEASLQAFFIWHPFTYLFYLPALSMRLWSEERRSGTIQLLLTLPIDPAQAVVGKFLAVWFFHFIALLLTLPIVWTVNYLGDPDNGVIFFGYVGSFLMAGSYLAIGSLASVFSRDQAISFLLTVVVCLVILLGGLPMVSSTVSSTCNLFLDPSDGVAMAELLGNMSFWKHFESIQQGIFDVGDLFYFISVIGASLTANVIVLHTRRAG